MGPRRPLGVAAMTLRPVRRAPTVSVSARVSVIVATYRRPDLLARCLGGLAGQALQPLEVIVVRRAGDHGTARALESPELGPCRVVEVHVPGVVEAMRAGAAAARGDVIAFLDDDTVPPPDWLRRLEPRFLDPAVGAVGGRDVIAGQEGPLTTRVGEVTAWGKLVGNHHLGSGPLREVEVLKGANMAFARRALALPAGLRGQGAQVHYEIATCLQAQRLGWKLLYDPSLRVRHDPGPRFDADRRGRPDPSAVADSAYNYVLALLTHRPALLVRRALFGLLLGDRAIPGLGRAALAAVRREQEVVHRLRPALKGQLEALVAFLRGERVRMVAVEAGTAVPEERTSEGRRRHSSP